MAKFWGIFFLVAWISGQIVRLPGEFPVTVLDVAVGGMVITEIIKKIKRSKDGEKRGERRSDKRINGQTDKLINGVILVLVASWVMGLRLFSWQESVPGGLYLLRFLGYLWVIANAGKLLAPVKKFIIPAFWIFIILAWIQYLFLPDTRFLLRYGWDEHYYRMIGTVLDPNYLGVMLGMIVVYAVEEEKKIKKQIDGEKIGKRSNGWLAVLALGGLVVTYSRASWLATGIGLSFIVIPYLIRNLYKFFYIDSPIKSGNDRKESGMTMNIFLGLIIFGLVLYMAPKPGGEGVNLFRTSSVEQRIESWKEGINVWREHPWLGVGFNNYKEYKESKDKERWGKDGEKNDGKIQIDHAENAPSSSWILLLATTGMVGVGGLTVNLFIEMIKKIKINKDVEKRGKRIEGNLLIGVLMMIGIHAVFNNTMFYPPVLGLLALIKVASED